MRFQFHLSTAFLLTVIVGLFIPTLLYIFGVRTVPNEAVRNTFIAACLTLFVLLSVLKMDIRDTVSMIMFASVLLGCIGFVIPTGKFIYGGINVGMIPGHGVPVAFFVDEYNLTANLMAPFINIFMIFAGGFAVLFAIRLGTPKPKM